MTDSNVNIYEKTVFIQSQYMENNKSVLWIKMHDIPDKLDVKNMSDVVIKQLRVFIILKLLQKFKLKNTKDIEKNL